MSIRIGLLLFDDVDLLDVGGPYEVFLTAGRLRERSGRPNPFEVVTVGLNLDPVTSYGGMGLVPTHTIDDVGHIDVVVIPGAIAIDEVASRPAIRSAVEQLTSVSEIVTSVCTGAFMLGDAGLLSNIDWTTHWEDVDALAARIGSNRGGEALWVDAGDVVTAGGLSNGIAMALHMVERLEDRALALATARQIDFRWS
jgi:transcriptional regulator GlxA family with amidase domain